MLKDTLIADVDLFLVQPLLVSKWQGVIRHNLQRALAGEKVGPKGLQNLLTAVHHGDIQVWVGVAGDEGERRTIGMLFTRVVNDPFLDSKRLLIYGLNLEAKISVESMTKCIDTLAVFARQRGCYAMVAQTRVNGIGRILENNGWTNGAKTFSKEL